MGYFAVANFGISTKQPSAVVRRFLEAHPSNVSVRIDRKHYSDVDREWLLTTWCTNRNIRSTIDFEIRQDGKPVFGFHDDINEAWADESESDVVGGLVRDKIARVRRPASQIAGRSSGPLTLRAFSWIQKLLRRGPGQ